MNSKTILIVDDSKTTVQVMQVYLMGQGFDFLVATSAREALAEVRKTAPDLVISDVNMPGMDGISLCVQLKALRQLPVIIVTSKLSVETRKAALNAGADGLLAKPVDQRKLLYMVKSLLGT